ncbi:MAG: hypothetical protein JXR89_04850, partial [Deltaproteobacteria bacterium]|nr:hypothetical protein [Deltaproteobacteria bacterium]
MGRMRGKSIFVLMVLGLLLTSGLAQAQLTVIGTATYLGTPYNLIWDDDNNGHSVVWLDYTNAPANWSTQTAWAAGLDAQLTYNIDPAYTVIWDDAAWRLPNTVDGQSDYGCDGTTTVGYNITTSEMGHLFYAELGNQGYLDTSCNTQSPYGLQNTGSFEHLVASWYWSGTEYAPDPDYAWSFGFDDGFQVGYGIVLHNDG